MVFCENLLKEKIGKMSNYGMSDNFHYKVDYLRLIRISLRRSFIAYMLVSRKVFPHKHASKLRENRAFITLPDS